MLRLIRLEMKWLSTRYTACIGSLTNRRIIIGRSSMLTMRVQIQILHKLYEYETHSIENWYVYLHNSDFDASTFFYYDRMSRYSNWTAQIIFNSLESTGIRRISLEAMQDQRKNPTTTTNEEDKCESKSLKSALIRKCYIVQRANSAENLLLKMEILISVVSSFSINIHQAMIYTSIMYVVYYDNNQLLKSLTLGPQKPQTPWLYQCIELHTINLVYPHHQP